MRWATALLLPSLLFLAAASADEGPAGPPSLVNLAYVEDPETMSWSGGSLVEAMQDVAKFIDSAGNVYGKAAVLQYKVSARIIDPEAKTWQIRLDVKQKLRRIGRKVKKRREVRGEMGTVDSRLGRWRKTLTAAQKQSIEKNGSAKIPVVTPFDRTRLLQHAPVKVTVRKPLRCRIGTLEISYIPIEVEQRALKGEIRGAREDALKAVADHAAQDAEGRKLDNRVRELSRAWRQKKGDLAVAETDMALFPKDVLKDAAYRAQETKIERTKKRMATIHERVTKHKHQISPNAMKSLLDEHAQLKRELPDQERALRKLGDGLGHPAARARIQKRIDGLKPEVYELKRLLVHATTDAGLKAKAVDRALDRMLKARRAQIQAVSRLRRLLAKGRPLITRVYTEHYHADLWTPGKSLAELNKIITMLGDQLRELTRSRLLRRREMAQAVDATNASADRLTTSMYKSAITQWGIEAADFVKGVRDSWKKGGPYAAGIAVIRKWVEITIFPPTYYDPAPPTDKPVILDPSWRGVGKRVVKTGTGEAAKAWTAKFLRKHSAEIFEDMWKDLMRSTWFEERMQKFDPQFSKKLSQTIAEQLADQRKVMQEAEANWEKFVGPGGEKWKGLAKRAAAGFIKGISKDIVKEAIKRQVAEYFEGPEWRDYVAAQAKLRYVSRMYLRTNRAYWDTLDLYEQQRIVRNYLVSQYDPSTQMRITKNAWFYPEAGYLIRLHTNDQDDAGAKNRFEIEVKLGGVVLERLQGSLTFALREGDVEKLKPDGEGKLALTIRVKG